VNPKPPTIMLCTTYLIFLLLLYWGNIIRFLKVLKVYHNYIHPLHHSSLSALPTFLE
jgi:hypothetical protein